MKKLEFDIEKYKKPTARDERDEQIQNFFNKQCIMIRDRKTKALRLATKSDLAKVLMYCPTKDLYPFFKECEGARSFSRYFWWSVKHKPDRRV